MEKIKNAFKPDAVKEAEARRAAEAAKGAETTDQTTSGAADSSTATTDFGSTSAQGVSSSQTDPSYATDSEKPSYQDEPVAPDHFQGMSAGGTSGSAYQTTTIPDRSVGATADSSSGAVTSGTHETVIGEQIDPNVGGNSQSYREVPGTSTVPTTTTDTSSIHDRDVALGAGAVGATGAGAAAYSSYNTAGSGTTSDYDPIKHEHHVEREAHWREQSGGGEFGVLHKHQQPKYQDPTETDTTAREKYFGDDHATHHVSPYQTRDESAAESSTAATTAAATGGTAVAGAAGYGAYEASQTRGSTETPSSPTTTQDTEKKRSGLSSLFHRDNPNKLHKEPKGGYPSSTRSRGASSWGSPPTITSTNTGTASTTAATATSAPKTTTASTTDAPVTTTSAATTGIPTTSTANTGIPTTTTASTGATPTTGSTTTATRAPLPHETFVRPTPEHEQHVGVDGPIGRSAQVSGLYGTDARRTSTAAEVDKSLDPSNPTYAPPEDKEPTLVERNAALGEGRVIDPTTGLPMNIGRFGSGSGGTDGTTAITGFDEQEHQQRLAAADELRASKEGMSWEKIKERDTPY